MTAENLCLLCLLCLFVANPYFAFGIAISRRLQMALTRKVGISRCLGIASLCFVTGFQKMVWFAPSLRNSQ